MARPRPEPVQVVKQRRDAALQALVQGVPYARFLGIDFDRRGDELTAVLRYDDKLIGNPLLPALHGGVTAAFLEVTAIMTLSWTILWPGIESGEVDVEAMVAGDLPRLPRTIGITVDYLRPGRAEDVFAVGTVTKQGRRVANVSARAWQSDPTKPIALASAHFLIQP